MKTTNKNFSGIIRIAIISFGIFALVMACDVPNDESTVNQDSIDSVKTLELKTVDTTAIKDTTKTVDASTTKP